MLVYHATRFAPSIRESGLQSPIRLPVGHVRGGGLNIAKHTVSTTPHRQGAELIAALFQSFNEAVSGHLPQVLRWYRRHLPMWVPPGERGFLEIAYRVNSSGVLFPVTPTRPPPVPARDIGYFTLRLDAEVVPYGHGAPLCPPGRGRYRRCQASDFVATDEEDCAELWEENFPDLSPQGRYASSRSTALDQDEIRACPEDLRLVSYTPVLSWRPILGSFLQEG